MEVDRRCFKIDRPNAMAMISGFFKDGKLHRQSIWLDVITKPFPMLISLNRSPTPFHLSELGRRLNPEEFLIPYKYVAMLDSEYHVTNDMRLWEKICSNSLFDIWDPFSPYRRFAESKSDPSRFRIQILRIYEINEEFQPNQIVPVSSRIDHLITPRRTFTIKAPVIPDREFYSIKVLLEESIVGFTNSV
jgi:hypothetical protein